jgi:hypothetical protein
MAKVLIDFPEDLHKDLKRRAIDDGVTLKKLIVEAAQEYIKRHPPLRQSLFEVDQKSQSE